MRECCGGLQVVHAVSWEIKMQLPLKRTYAHRQTDRQTTAWTYALKLLKILVASCSPHSVRYLSLKTKHNVLFYESLIALRCLLLMLVSTPLRIIANRCNSGFPVSCAVHVWMSGPLTFKPLTARNGEKLRKICYQKFNYFKKLNYRYFRKRTTCIIHTSYN